MMDDKKIEKLDEQSEYQFDSAEIGNSSETLETPALETDAPPPTDRKKDFKNIFKNLGKNRQLLKPLLLIAAVILVYMVFNLMGAYRRNAHEDAQVLMQEQAHQVIENNNLPVATVAVDSIRDSEQVKIMTDLQQELANVVSNETKLERELSDFREQIYELKQQLQGLDAKVVELADQAKKKVQPEISNKKPVKKQHKTVRHHYALQAVLGGRAWLKDEVGRTITVEVGTLIAGYGKVTQISEKQGGLVVTSDGSLIQLEI